MSKDREIPRIRVSRRTLLKGWRTDPALGIAELPELDAVLLSHLHGDHFDRIARRGLSRDQPVLTTPAAARRRSPVRRT